MKRLWDGISAAFAEEAGARDYAKEYLAELRTNWRDTDKSLTRLSTLILALAVVFELIRARQAGKVITFLGVELSTNNVIEFALPVVVAYLYYALALSFMDDVIFADGHDAVVSKVWPSISERQVDKLLEPGNSLLGVSRRLTYMLESYDRAAKWGSFTTDLRPLVMILGSPVFLIVAYIQLFAGYGVHSALLWVSTGLSLTILAIGVGTFGIIMSKMPLGPDV
jgi:hypothetical protein